nr:MAG TPA: hypothetical protein [Caudoviricetes sp.]
MGFFAASASAIVPVTLSMLVRISCACSKMSFRIGCHFLFFGFYAKGLQSCFKLFQLRFLLGFYFFGFFGIVTH